MAPLRTRAGGTIEWNPRLHPRDRAGRFREALGMIRSGTARSITLPDGTKVLPPSGRTTGFLVQRPGGAPERMTGTEVMRLATGVGPGRQMDHMGGREVKGPSRGMAEPGGGRQPSIRSLQRARENAIKARVDYGEGSPQHQKAVEKYNRMLDAEMPPSPAQRRRGPVDPGAETPTGDLVAVRQLKRGDWFADSGGDRYQVTKKTKGGGVQARDQGGEGISTFAGFETVSRTNAPRGMAEPGFRGRRDLESGLKGGPADVGDVVQVQGGIDGGEFGTVEQVRDGVASVRLDSGRTRQFRLDRLQRTTLGGRGMAERGTGDRASALRARRAAAREKVTGERSPGRKLTKADLDLLNNVAGDEIHGDLGDEMMDRLGRGGGDLTPSEWQEVSLRMSDAADDDSGFQDPAVGKRWMALRAKVTGLGRERRGGRGMAEPGSGAGADRASLPGFDEAGDPLGYMGDAYGPDEWAKVARFLLSKGHSEHEAHSIMMSKHMRWADDSEGPGHGKRRGSAAFKRYYNKRDAEKNVFNSREPGGFWKAEARGMAEETPPRIESADRPRGMPSGGAHEGNRTARSPSGNIRNLRAMSDKKLRGVIADVVRENNDPEAMSALQAEGQRRGWDVPRPTGGGGETPAGGGGRRPGASVEDVSEPQGELRVGFVRKPDQIGEREAALEGEPHSVTITRRVRLTPDAFDAWGRRPLEDKEWLTGVPKAERGRTAVVEVTDGNRRVWVDTQGYDYARYVAYPEGGPGGRLMPDDPERQRLERQRAVTERLRSQLPEGGGGGEPDVGTRSARSPAGRLRNLRQMKDEKFSDVASRVEEENNDSEALDAVAQERTRRANAAGGGAETPSGGGADIAAEARSALADAEQGDMESLIDLLFKLQDDPDFRPTETGPDDAVAALEDAQMGDYDAAIELLERLRDRGRR